MSKGETKGKRKKSIPITVKILESLKTGRRAPPETLKEKKEEREKGKETPR